MSDGLLSDLATRLGKKLTLTTDDWEKYNPSISFDVLSRCEAKVLYPHLRQLEQLQGAPKSEIPTPTPRANTQIEGTPPSSRTASQASCTFKYRRTGDICGKPEGHRLHKGLAHDHDFVPGATVATFARGELVIDDRDRIGKVLSNDEHGIIVCFSNVEPQFLIPGEYRFFGCLTHWDGYRKGARR